VIYGFFIVLDATVALAGACAFSAACAGVFTDEFEGCDSDGDSDDGGGGGNGGGIVFAIPYFM
jgi:hypothetical protein